MGAGRDKSAAYAVAPTAVEAAIAVMRIRINRPSMRCDAFATSQTITIACMITSPLWRDRYRETSRAALPAAFDCDKRLATTASTTLGATHRTGDVVALGLAER